MKWLLSLRPDSFEVCDVSVFFLIVLGLVVSTVWAVEVRAESSPASRYLIITATDHPTTTSVVKSPSYARYKPNAVVTVSPAIKDSAREDLIFSYWTGSLPPGTRATSSSVRLTMDRDQTLTAHFIPASKLEINLLNEVTGRAQEVFSQVYPTGSLIHLFAMPEPGYDFSGWKNGISTLATTSALEIKLDEPTTLNLIYRRRSSIRPQPGVVYAPTTLGVGIQVIASSTVPSVLVPTSFASVNPDLTVPPIFAPLPSNLRMGDTGPEVLLLQRMLAQGGYYHQTPTGVYDATTNQAVRSFQESQKITTPSSMQGLVGPGTLARLNALYAATTTSATLFLSLSPEAAAEATRLTNWIQEIQNQIELLSAQNQ